jgi:chromosomal replication initiator protein|tara:strand:- start:1608 stop:2960 length:1353 start_codon:yes stop_codon:yes gene_type:complete
MRSTQELWEAALGEIQLQVNKPNFRTWFQETKGISYQGDQFVIGVPNIFVAEYFETNQRSLIEKTLVGLTNCNITVRFLVNSAQLDSPAGYTRRGTAANNITSPTRFNLKYTFDSFIVGSSNRLAHNAALGAAQNPGQDYNPLFIYGGVGLGKTHLLQAIRYFAQTQNQAVLYVSGEQFTNEFINAIREQKTDEFRRKYRDPDILLVDDIHFINGKKSTAESFFHTFNALHNSGRQIVLTSDRPPKSIPGLEEKLRSRFEWGLTATIEPPNLDTRLAILQAKAKQTGADIIPEVLTLIAQQARGNIRELEGNLNRVLAYAKLLGAKPTLELACHALKDISSKATEDNHSTPTLIITAVAESFQRTSQDLTSRRRDKETALARQIAMYLVRRQNGCSLAEVGLALGGRNPSTVSHACQKIDCYVKNSPLLNRKVKQIQKTINLKLKGKVFQ